MSNDQLVSYLPFRDLGTLGFDEVLGQPWPSVGTFTGVTGPGIGVPEVNPANMFIPTAGAALPNDVIFYGIDA